MRSCDECRFWCLDEDRPDGKDFSWGFCRPVPHRERNERPSTEAECWFFKGIEGFDEEEVSLPGEEVETEEQKWERVCEQRKAARK